MRNSEPWEALVEVIERGNAEEVEAFVVSPAPAETALAIPRLDDDIRGRLVSMLTPDEAADLLHDLSEDQAAGVTTEISAAAAAAIGHR